MKPIEMPRHHLRLLVTVALGHPLVVQELAASLDRRKGAFGGAEDLRGDFADADMIMDIDEQWQSWVVP